MYITFNIKFRMWSYTDVYRALVNYVVQDLKDGAYQLNWGILAIAELTPRVIVWFTLRNISNNHSKMWTTVLVGETMAQLTVSAHNQVNRHKEELV